MQLYIWLQESICTHHSGVLEWIWIISSMTPDHLTSSLQVLALKGWLKWFFSNLNISSSLRTYRAAQQGVCEASRSFNLSERRGPLESADQSLISLPLQFFQIDSWARKEGQRRIRRDTSFYPSGKNEDHCTYLPRNIYLQTFLIKTDLQTHCSKMPSHLLVISVQYRELEIRWAMGLNPAGEVWETVQSVYGARRWGSFFP